MVEAFVALFITNSRKAREMDALLTMKLQDNETIKNYSIRYWETYNDIDGRSEEVAIKAFKLGLPVDSGLRHSLVKRQPSSLVSTWQPNTLETVATGIIHVIHDPLCSIVSTGSYRSQMQKAAHLRRSFFVINSVHPAPICSVSGGAMEQVISFSDSDLKDVQLPHNDPLVVTLRIGNYDVERILIN